MNCPYCNGDMQAGVIRFDGRSGCRWEREGESIGFWDSLGGVGTLTAADIRMFSGGRLPGHFCPSCKKLIIDTDLTK